MPGRQGRSSAEQMESWSWQGRRGRARNASRARLMSRNPVTGPGEGGGNTDMRWETGTGPQDVASGGT